MSKETTPSEKETPELINVDAPPSFDGSKESLNNLIKRIRQQKKDFPDSSPQARTPQKITDPQFFKAIFEAGATSHQILPPKDKE